MPICQKKPFFSTSNQQQLMLDSPALIDLGHGTVRYRLPDEKREQENMKVKTGYFYHPRLDDFSEGMTHIHRFD